jgi:putative endopeptidase
MNKNEMYALFCPFYWKVSQDLKNVDKMQSYISSPEFSLPNTEIYFDDGKNEAYKKKSRKEFVDYVDNVFKCCFGEKHGFNAKDIYDVEKELIMTFSCKNIKEPKDDYARITADQAIKTYKFDWEKLSKAIGFTKTPDFFITSNLSYLKCGTDLLLKNWNTDPWKTYWIFIYIRQLTRFSSKGKEIYNDFYAKMVIGEKDIIDKRLGAVILTTYAFNTLITQKYVKEYSIPENIEYTKTLCHELKDVFTRIIERNTWLQPKTKKYALLKLKHFKFYIGETGVLQSDPILKYNKKDIWYNLLLLADYRHYQFIQHNNKTPNNLPLVVWSMFSTPFAFSNLQAYIVNASYTPSKNAITIPIAYMQSPFLKLNSLHSFEYNLAHIGFTVGHEMSHSLDDWGSKYDYNGNLNDWWTPNDKKNYKNIQNDIIKQYEAWAKRDGITYDASKTIGEDLADISGLSTVVEYLLDFQYKNKEFPAITRIVFISLFIFYAYQMRQFETKKALAYQLEKNVHPPNKYRTNVPLSRTPLFRKIYDIKKSDDMYWNSTNRVWQN